MNILTEGVLEVPMIYIMALICEIDLYHEWMPNLTYNKTEHFYTNYRQLIRIRVDLPILQNREIVVRSAGFQCEKENGILNIG